MLNDYLTARIGNGIEAFFIAMRRAFADRLPSMVHILLAGNASRSEIVENYFLSERGNALIGETADLLYDAFDGESVPEIVVHRAPEGGAGHPAMGKTGVALGLLRLCPGGPVTIQRTTPGVSGHEAPFAYFVGRIRRGAFHALLSQGQAYGTWIELGTPRDRVLRLTYTRSALGHTDDLVEGHKELVQRRLEFVSDDGGNRVFARAVAPHEIEVCLAASLDALQNGAFEELQIIKLQ